MTFRKWADPMTKEGQIEKIIEGVLSGGARDEHVNEVVKAILDFVEKEINGRK